MNNDYDHDYNFDVIILTKIKNDIVLLTVYKTEYQCYVHLKIYPLENIFTDMLCPSKLDLNL